MNTLNILPSEIFEANQILTVAKAKELKGKSIATTSAEYLGNHQHVNIFTVVDIISEWDLAANVAADGWPNRQAYWASFMTSKRIDELKNTPMLLDEKCGTWHRAHTYSDLYVTPTFTGSDADRTIYYIDLFEVLANAKNWRDEKPVLQAFLSVANNGQCMHLRSVCKCQDLKDHLYILLTDQLAGPEQDWHDKYNAASKAGDLASMQHLCGAGKY